MLRKIALVLLALCLLPAAAHAQRRLSDYASRGGYMNLGGVNGFETFQNDSGLDFDTSFGFNFAGGWRFHPRVSAELEFDFLTGFDVDVPANFQGAGNPPVSVGLTVPGGVFSANAKGYLLTGRIQPYVLGGVGVLWADLRTRNATGLACGFWYCVGTQTVFTDGAAFAGRVGGGIDFWLTKEWGLNLDATYVIPTSDLAPLRFVSLQWGIVHLF